VAPGSFFALRTETGGEVEARILATEGAYSLTPVPDIDYDGLFPKAELEFVDSALPVEVRLRASGTIAPHNYDDSSLPVALFTFGVENVTDEPVNLSLAFSWQNLLGCGGWIVGKWAQVELPPDLQRQRAKKVEWRDVTGNYQEPVEQDGLSGLIFDSKKKEPAASYGNYCLLAQGPEGFSASHLTSWNSKGDGADFTKGFAETGVLSGGEAREGVQDKYDPAGAVALSGVIELGDTRELVFALAWHMPGHYAWNLPEKAIRYGHWHEKNFDHSSKIAAYALANRKKLEAAAFEIGHKLGRSNLPAWLSEKLANDMFPANCCSWYAGDGRFSISEAPSNMSGCMGTIDQRTASHTIWTTFWPRLDAKELDMFRLTQAENGSIAHDVGWYDLESLRKGSKWVDLPCSYILECYHHWMWTGDEEFITAMYDSMKRAALYEMSDEAEPDGDGLPDAGGGTTYDAYFWHGANSFVGTLWLASLRALERLAEKFDDGDFAETCRRAFDRTRDSMMERLWTGEYFRNYNDDRVSGKVDDAVCSGQLAGVWLGHLLDLGEILPLDIVQRALTTMYNVCLKKVPYGVADVISLEGEVTKGNHGWTCSWIPYVQAYMATVAFQSGMPDIGMETTKRCRDMVYERDKRPWEAYLAYDVFTGKGIWGRWYMTHPASWAVFWAIQGFTYSVPDAKLSLAPSLPSDMNSLSAPVFGADFWGWMEYEANRPGSMKLDFEVQRVFADEERAFKVFETRIPEGISAESLILTIDGEPLEKEHSFGENRKVCFECRLPLRVGARLSLKAGCGGCRNRQRQYV
jgi:non-lysosomal glucosylceramidase